MVKNPASSGSGQRPRPADAVLEQADLALRMQRPADAARLAEGVLKADRGHVAAASILGHAFLALGRADEAIVHLERAARRGSNPAVETLLAVALAAAGRRDDALARLQVVTGTNAAYAPAFREHAAQLVTLKRIDDAVAVITRGVSVCPTAVELHLDLAALHLQRNDRAAAMKALRIAREVAPGRADVLAELARVMLLDGDYASAAETYRHALALQPDHAMNRSNLAACQLELGQREAGETTLRAAVQGRPQMIGRGVHALSMSSHGRFFLRPSAAEAFLRGEKS